MRSAASRRTGRATSTRWRPRCSCNMRWGARGKSLVVALAAVLLFACGPSEVEPARVTIPPGATMRSAAESLHQAGIIRSPRLFQLYAKLRRFDRGIKAGTYLLREREHWGVVLDALRSGRGIVNVVTVPEGFKVELRHRRREASAGPHPALGACYRRGGTRSPRRGRIAASAAHRYRR